MSKSFLSLFVTLFFLFIFFLEGGWGYAEGLAKYPGEVVPISEACHLRNLPDGMFSSLEQLLGFLHTYARQVFQK